MLLYPCTALLGMYPPFVTSLMQAQPHNAVYKLYIHQAIGEKLIDQYINFPTWE